MFKGIYISKKYKDYLKQNGLADCSPKEAVQEATFRKRVMAETYKERTKKFTEKVADKMYYDNVLEHFGSYLKRGKNG